MKNKKKILKYLVPVEMNLYNFPSKALLQRYQLPEYAGIAEACTTGDIIKLEQNIE